MKKLAFRLYFMITHIPPQLRFLWVQSRDAYAKRLRVKAPKVPWR